MILARVLGAALVMAFVGLMGWLAFRLMAVAVVTVWRAS